MQKFKYTVALNSKIYNMQLCRIVFWLILLDENPSKSMKSNLILLVLNLTLHQLDLTKIILFTSD